jgi:hypothetical protein
MIHLGTVLTRNCQGISRRQALQIGGSSILGLGLADVLRTEASPAGGRKNRARSCILIYLAGGPSQLETFDPKPQAPAEIRGPWGAIASKVPGTHVSELLPRLATCADQYALIRSIHHTNSVHMPLPMMTGNMTQNTAYGAAFTFLTKRTAGMMPPYVHLGGDPAGDNSYKGLAAGPLGAAFNPYEIRNPTERQGMLADFTLSAEVTPQRLTDRKLLLGEVDGLRRRLGDDAGLRVHDGYRQRALRLLTSTYVRDAFDLTRESEVVRDRYGANFFGQSCLLARRLIQAGTRFVQIMWYDRVDGFEVGWDVHGYDAPGLIRMEQQLCPRLDQGLSALLDDLRQRGMLESTLVCVTGEFGRTPTCNKHGGRDHWPYCFSALLAGAGVRGGAVVGASDARAAYPVARPVKPADFAATLYHLLGVDVNRDDRLRSAVFEGSPVHELCEV